MAPRVVLSLGDALDGATAFSSKATWIKGQMRLTGVFLSLAS